jgi:filamentous hemagglutinin
VVKEAAALGTTEAEAVRFGTAANGLINKFVLLGVVKATAKVVKGGKGTAKSLSASEAGAVSKEIFHQKQTAPAELQASISRGITEAVETNPLMKAQAIRFDIIKEQEMIQRALATPHEWNSQFKLVREIQPTASGHEFSSNVYSREVIFKDPKTQQMFRAFQRNDIDPGYVIRTGPDTGKSNISLLQKGRAPYTLADEQVIIHHMGQSAQGPFIEVTKTTHKPLLHNQFGYRQLHPTFPVVRSEFDPIREAYWRAYAESFK